MKVKEVGIFKVALQLLAEKWDSIEGIWVDLSFQPPHGFKNQAGKVSGYSGST